MAHLGDNELNKDVSSEINCVTIIRTPLNENILQSVPWNTRNDDNYVNTMAADVLATQEPGHQQPWYWIYTITESLLSFYILAVPSVSMFMVPAVLEQQENQENQGSLSSNTLRSPQRCRSPSHSVIKKPLQLANEPASLLSGLHSDTHGIHTSPQGSSDFGRCSSLDYDPSSSAEFLRHSSEEELTGINCTFREKRTWSQANHCNSCEPYSSGSSDEEVKDLLCSTQPVLFSSSPPKGVHRFSKTLSPRVFLARVSPGCTSSVSPRKRHRQTLSNDVSDASTVIQRPCIDFEKMQVSVPWWCDGAYFTNHLFY